MLRGKDQGEEPTSPLSYGEQFRQILPHYISMGMTPADFWDGDSTLVVAYRKAKELRNEERNQELWLQGMYFYEALCDAAPILRAFAKKGTKPHKYPSEPYALTVKEKKQKEDNHDKQTFEKGLAMMSAWAKKTNEKLTTPEKKEVKDNAHDR